MVAYSFKKRFVPLIEAGLKRQTIRGERKRHARRGEPLQLYFGMRTAHCRKIIDDPICEAVWPISLWVPTKLEPCTIRFGGAGRYIDHDFAVRDGFESVEDFTRFWFDTHGPGTFHGVVIGWGPAP